MTEKDEKTMAGFQEKLEEMIKTEVTRRMVERHIIEYLSGVQVSDYLKRRCREDVIYILRRAMTEIR